MALAKEGLAQGPVLPSGADRVPVNRDVLVQVDRHRRSRHLTGRSLGPEGLLDLRHPRHHQTGLNRINWFKLDQPVGDRSSSASREHWIIFK